MSGWGNYKSDGIKEAKVLLVVVSLSAARILCLPEDVRTAAFCPEGINAENVRKILERDPSWSCKPRDELLSRYFSTEFVAPGTPEWGRPPWAR